MLGEFFLAGADEIDDSLLEEGPYGRFPTLEAKAITSVKIAGLGEILGVGTYDDLFAHVDGRQATSGEAGIDTVPTELRDALAKVENPDPVVREWSETGELAYWEPKEARQVVVELAAFARQARETDRELWFWWSL